MNGGVPWSRLWRGLVSVAVLAALYGVAAEIGGPFLPTRVWIAVHYVEGVELLPRYPSLAEEAIFLVQAGILQGGVLVSGARVLAGVLLGSLVGIPLGVGMAWAAWFEHLVDPWAVFFRFTPALALLPLYVLWLGFGEPSRILLIATAVAIVTLHGAFHGVRDVPRLYLDSATALGAPARMTVARIALPAALPHIVGSVRIATAVAWVTVVVAELIHPTMPSLGYLLTLAGTYPRVPTIVVALATIGVVVLASDALVLALYHRATRWMRRRRA